MGKVPCWQKLREDRRRPGLRHAEGFHPLSSGEHSVSSRVTGQVPPRPGEGLEGYTSPLPCLSRQAVGEKLLLFPHSEL